MGKLKTILIIIFVAIVGYILYQTYNNNWNLNQTVTDTTTEIQRIGGNLIKDPASAGTIALAAVTPVIGVAKLAYDGLKTRASKQISDISVDANERVTEANQQVLQLAEEKEQLQTELGALEKKVTELEAMPNDSAALQATLTKKETEYRIGIQTLQGQHDNFVQQLIKAADGAWVVDASTGKRYQVLKPDPQVIVT